MSLEGRFRDLKLAEVMQLLASGSRTGVLHCGAPLLGRWLRIAMDGGVVAQVWSGSIADAWGEQKSSSADDTEMNCPALPEREAREAILDAMRWTHGSFRFRAGETSTSADRLRLAVDHVLMDAAFQATVWAEIEDIVPHSRVVPTFAAVSAQQLPELHLTALQWEVLTHVDGRRNLVQLAVAMRRQSYEVAEQICRLIEVGLVALRESEGIRRRNPTPPSSHAVESQQLAWQAVENPTVGEVAGTPFRPSISGKESAKSVELERVSQLRAAGSEFVRQGDLPQAVIVWTEALGAARSAEEAVRLSMMIELASRLHALLLE